MFVNFFFPFILGMIYFFFGKSLGRVYSSFLGIFLYFYCFLLFLFSFFEMSMWQNIIDMNLWSWMKLGFWNINIEFYFDTLSNMMFFLVLIMSSFVLLYSWDYMEGDPHKSRFFAYLGFFTFFMLLLVLSGNLMCLFIGWEGVGLSSYLLISFWFTRLVAVKAAMKAMVMNSVGDVFLLLACVLFLLKFNSLNFVILKNLIYFYYFFFKDLYIFLFDLNFFVVLGFSLFLGAMSKSAQLGLHTWLPDAMEGPTPVSALIHAATMVTAGVFLVMRFSFFFEYVPIVLLFITFVGVLTCFFAAIMGLFQFDMKKIVAYSTCSQLGYMFFSCGFSNYSVAFFHLFNHGFFKALLFLSMGSMMHAYQDEQDFSKMGGSYSFLSFSFLSVFMGSWALLGLPFFSGFYSKDLLLEMSFFRLSWASSFVYLLGIFGAFFTAFYSTSLVIWVFFSKVNSFRKMFLKLHESEGFIFFVLYCLMVLSIFVGYFFFDFFVGVGSYFFFKSIYLAYNSYNIFDVEFGLTFFVKVLPLVFSFFGVLSYIFFWINSVFVMLFLKKNMEKYVEMHTFFTTALLFDNLYNNIFLKFLNYNYKFFFKLIEQNFLEWTGFGFFYFFFNFLNRIFNYIYFYFFFSMMFMVVSLFLFFFFYFFIFFKIKMIYFFLILMMNLLFFF